MKKREKTKTLSEIKTIVTDLIRKIPAEKSDLPAFGIAQDFAEPFIEVDEEGYSFVIMERGHELQRLHINELDDFLYIVLEDITEKISIRQAAQRNVDNVDSRRISFELQEALMADLNPEWGLRVRKKHAAILAEHPFDDSGRVRADFCSQLISEGIEPELAWERSCIRYPLPHRKMDMRL